MELHSIRLETQALGALCQLPAVWAEVENFHVDQDYINDTHRTIFSVIKNTYDNAEELDKVLLAQKLKDLGIHFRDDLDIFDYIEELFNIKITKKGGINAIKKLQLYRIRRELVSATQEAQNFVKNAEDKNIDQIIEGYDSLLNDPINLYTTNDQPEDIFANAIEIIEERGNNPVEEAGLKIPYERFQNIYGGLTEGDVFTFIAKKGEGKSTLVNDMAFKATYLNPNCKVLILDTEMQKYQVLFRLAGAITGVNPWYYKTGNFNRNPELRQIWEDNKETIKEARDRIYHRQVTGKPIDEVLSLAKRWKHQVVGRDNPAIIVYDYIKVTGEESNNKAEYQLLGDKINKLKELATQLNVPILTANQRNRNLEDDDRASSQSDRIGWISSYMGLFRKKTEDEVLQDGQEFGTHKLLTLKAREQGKEAAGHFDFVKVPQKDGKKKYKQNFISFNVRSFDVQERGTLQDIVDSQNEEYNIEQEVFEDKSL